MSAIMLRTAARSLAALSGLALLAACANPRTDEVMQAQDALVGMPVETLLSCAGVPERRASAAGTDFFTYVGAQGAGTAGPTTSLGVGLGTGGGGFGFGLGLPLGTAGGGIQRDACEATFTVRNGVVQQVRYSGDAVGECYPVVANCLAVATGPVSAVR
ncbi:hypothetical protein [Arenibaculum sp.]|jgi:hypothetical protein|uniref:hypothetical protein n=1 Tax=Arenibaculum sp. TaxID=2865862 RepID=UPI002E110873|nr:hypothetical protein [Arenibaculum sp.]